MSLDRIDEIKELLEQLLPGVAINVEEGSLLVEPKDLIAVCRCLKETERSECDYLSGVTAVDYPPESIVVVYHLYSMTKKEGPLTLKVKLDRANPKITSVTPIWRSAEFQEREVYDLFGVQFEEHPDLRRILMWDEFVGHPMRKDFVHEDQNVLEQDES